MSIGEVLEKLHNLGGQEEIHPADLVLHHAVTGDEKDNHRAAGGGDQLNFAHLGALFGEGGGDDRAAGVLRQGPGGVLQQPVRVRVAEVEKSLNLLLFLRGEGFLPHQLIQVKAVAQVGGDPSGGGVGLFQQAQLKEHRHFVAHGGGGDLPIQEAGYQLGAHRLPGGDVGLHDGGEDAQLPGVQFHPVHRLSFWFLALVEVEC